MIEPSASVSPSAAPVSGPRRRTTPRLPVGQRTARTLVLAGVFVCAACGLVYELELVALASYLMGDSVTQTSVVISLMVFAMGAGSLGAKRLRPYAVTGFAALEAVLALVGGLSGMALYAAFAWAGDLPATWPGGPRTLLVLCSLAIGLLIGAEVPLLMVLSQRVSRQDPGVAVANLFAADYVGALIGGLAFPFLLLPQLGELTAGLLTGAVNVLAGGALVLGLFRGDVRPRERRLLLAVTTVVLALLATAAVLADDFERTARQALYGADVRVAVHTDLQDVVLTGTPDGPFELFLDGRLRVRSGDEPRYHRHLVDPAAAAGPRARVLVLGGDDGLAADAVLRQRGVRRVDVVALDAGVVRLARTDPALSALNDHAFGDPRVHVVTGDPFVRLRVPHRHYDLVVLDLPEPARTAATKYYSQEFYGLVGRVLAPGGRCVVHAGRAGPEDGAFWTVDATLRAAGLRTAPYRAGRWGFVLAAHGTDTALLRVDGASAGGGGASDAGGASSAGGSSGAGGASGADAGGSSDAGGASGADAGIRQLAGARPSGVPPSTLVHPRYGG